MGMPDGEIGLSRDLFAKVNRGGIEGVDLARKTFQQTDQPEAER